MKKLFRNEIDALKNLEHPNIIKLLNFSENSNAINLDGKAIQVMYIALEYANNG
jgi:serine/threonine protein kinase